MGRDVKRVPLDFADHHPIGEAWQGYINPHYTKCKDCDGTGQSGDYRVLSSCVSQLLSAGADGSKNRSFKSSLYGLVKVTPAMTEVTAGLAGRSPGTLGHDAIDRFNAINKILEAAGVNPDNFGRCAACNGEGVSAEHFKAYNEWVPTDPPTGDGYQLWENVSEGSPISPVFKTRDELVDWMEQQGEYSQGSLDIIRNGGDYIPTMFSF